MQKKPLKKYMISKNLQLKNINDGLHFLSLGGIGEIGANCYLYGWIYTYRKNYYHLGRWH